MSGLSTAIPIPFEHARIDLRQFRTAAIPLAIVSANLIKSKARDNGLIWELIIIKP